jgi:hypothetical protein
MRNKNLQLLLILLALSQCSGQREISPPIERAFYYWKTTANFGTDDNQLYQDLAVQTLYVRYFDIDWSPTHQDAVPLGVLNTYSYDADWANKRIIPTVFITNRTFQQLDAAGREKLATRIAAKIQQLSEEMKGWDAPALDIQEVQIDCDWTASTREAFFSFLKTMQQQIPDKTLSCTVRLHQYRDRDAMGIPPVKRGLLMCYNVAEVDDLKTKNAILDATVVQQYLDAKPYPILLDVGLPMFSWAAAYRNGAFQGLIAGWDEADAENKDLYKPTSDHRYLLNADTVIQQKYLRTGDLLRWDAGFEDEMDETIDILIKKWATLSKNDEKTPVRLAFFDWETSKIKKNESKIQNYYHRFD